MAFYQVLTRSTFPKSRHILWISNVSSSDVRLQELIMRAVSFKGSRTKRTKETEVALNRDLGENIQTSDGQKPCGFCGLVREATDLTENSVS